MPRKAIKKENCRICNVKLIFGENIRKNATRYICRACASKAEKDRKILKIKDKIEPKIIYNVKFCVYCTKELQDYNWSEYLQKRKYYICNICYSENKIYNPITLCNTMSAKPKIIYDVKYCLDCFIELQNYNWSKAHQERHQYLCNHCHNKRERIKNSKKRLLKPKIIYDVKYCYSCDCELQDYNQLECLKDKNICNPCFRKQANKYLKKRRKNLIYKLRDNVSATIYAYLNRSFSSKNGESCIPHLEFTVNQLKEHLESLFEPWMTWNNWGVYNRNIWDDNDPITWTWQIDHIIPQSDLPSEDMESDNFKKCWSLDNLRPYSAKQNILDGTSKIRHKKD